MEHFPLFLVVTAAGCCWWEDREVERSPIPSIRILCSMQVGFGWFLVCFFFTFCACVCLQFISRWRVSLKFCVRLIRHLLTI